MERVVGPNVNTSTQVHNYTVCAEERPVHFDVIPEEKGVESGWAVRIEGIPAPSIVHEHPWPSVDAARDAALRAINVMLQLEQVQREEVER